MYRESFITLLLGLFLPTLLYSEIPMPVVQDTSEELLRQQLDSVSTLVAAADYPSAATYLDQISEPRTPALAREYYHLLGLSLIHI